MYLSICIEVEGMKVHLFQVRSLKMYFPTQFETKLIHTVNYNISV